MSGVVAGANERSAGDHVEAESSHELSEFIEFFGGHVSFDRQVFDRGLEVLSDGDHAAPGVSEIGTDFEDFFGGFTESEHQATFCRDFGPLVADSFEQIECSLVVGISSDAVIEPGYGFGVVVEDIGAGFEHSVDGLGVAHEVGCEHFDGGSGEFTNGQHAVVEVIGSPVVQVVSGDGSDDDVCESESLGGFGHSLGFIEFDRFGFPLGDAAEATGPGADVAEDHEGRRLLAPALGPIRAAGTFADRLQPEVGQDPLGPQHARFGHRSFQPFRQPTLGPLDDRQQVGCGQVRRGHGPFSWFVRAAGARCKCASCRSPIGRRGVEQGVRGWCAWRRVATSERPVTWVRCRFRFRYRFRYRSPVS